MDNKQEHKDFRKELESIAPCLLRISLENPFQVPENYFSDMKEAIQERVMLENAAPSLFDLDRKKDFDIPQDYFNKLESEIISKMEMESENEEHVAVPEEYFDKMHDSIMSKIEKEEQKDTRILPLRERYSASFMVLSVVGAAAMILLAVLFFKPEKRDCQTFACLLEQTSFTNDDLLYFSGEELYEVYEEEIEDSDGEMEYDEDITEYLIESDLDIDEIYEEIYDDYDED